MFRSLARRVYGQNQGVAALLAARAASTQAVASAQSLQDRADHILRLTQPLSPQEPSLLLQQTELLKQIPQPASIEDLGLALKVFDKVAEMASGVDKFSCARLSLMCINSGAPDKALEPWTRLLEELSSKTHPRALPGILARPDFEPAAMAALAAYFLVSGPAADMNIAQKLVPRLPVPQGLNVLRSVGAIKSEEAAKLVTSGLAKLRKHTTNNFTSSTFLAEVADAQFARVSQLWEQVNLADTPPEIAEITYAAFIKRFAETRQTKKSFQIWQQLTQAGVTATTVAWAALLKTALHAPQNSVEIFDGFWDKMLSNGFQPDAACYSERLLRLTRNEQLGEANELFQNLKKWHESGVNNEKWVEPRALNVIVSALAKAQKFDDVDSLLQWAENNNVELSSHTLNPLLQASRGDSELSSKYLAKMTDLGIKPDIVTYTFAVDQMLKRGLPVNDLLTEMKEAKIAPSEQFQTMLAYNIGKASKNVSLARQLMSTMLQQKMKISLVTLGAFIELELKYGDTQRAVQYVELIQKLGLPPNIPTYNQLISGSLRRREFDIAQRAFDKLSAGSHLRLMPNVHTYMALLTPWNTADLQNSRPVRNLLRHALPFLLKQPQLVDYSLVKQIERVSEHAPEVVPPELKELANRRGLELFDKMKSN